MIRTLYYSSPLLQKLVMPLISIRHSWINFFEQSGIQACNRLTETLVDDVVVRVDAFDGIFKMGPASHLLHRILMTGSYEPELAAAAKAACDPKRDVIDVGANIGFFSIMLAKRLTSGRLLAIEPTVAALTRLNSNIERNGVKDSVIVFHGLASSTDGFGEVKTFDGMEEYSTAGVVDHFAVRGVTPTFERVEQLTIDSLAKKYSLSPGFIKIDVEGYEMEVLKGASQTLSTHRPIILSELCDPLLRKNGTSSQAVIDFLRSHDYEVTDPLYPDVLAGKRQYADIIAVPLFKR